ncbi:MAG: alpha/beta hydrolase [Candidatus Aenigmatarchaeota archaeon]
MKKWIVFESNGTELCGILSTVDNTRPVIILTHGFMSSKDSNTYRILESKLNNAGINTFRFDFYGSGQSKGKFEDITLSKAVKNIMDAIAFMNHCGFKKIGLFGSSFGGSASILTASISKYLYILALSSSPSDYTETYYQMLGDNGLEKWKQDGFITRTNSEAKEFRINYSFYEDIKKHNIYEAEKNITIPVLIVHGDCDKTVPIEQSIKASKIIPNCVLETIQGADHLYTNPEHYEKRIALITNFIINNS